MINRIEINLEQLIAGSLLKFKEIDNLDLRLLINDFRKKHKLYTNFRLDTISEYVFVHSDGIIELNRKYSLDTKLETENCVLSEKLKSVAGNIVNNYIDSLDLEQFKKDKETFFNEQKQLMQEEAKVLLISSCIDDYNGLKKYGFMNVDFFKSYIRADRYFQEHFDELSKYQIILLGNNNIRECEVNTGLEERIRFLTGYRDRVISYIHRSNNSIEIVMYDNENWRRYNVKEKYFADIAKAIFENAAINNVLEVKNNIYDYSLIEDYVNPDKLPLPTRKKELKILCLVPYCTEDKTKDISKNLGLNITFAEDSNYGIANNVINELGNYDIVIASELYSKRLLGLAGESTEQCKDTGRNLTLLLTYDSSFVGINLNYVCGGNLAINNEVSSKEYKLLKPLTKGSSKEQTELQSIIEQAVCIYNETLVKTKNPSISDFDFNSIEDYTAEYQAALEAIDVVNNIIIKSKNYLYYKKEGAIKTKLDGLRIYENENGLCVENYLQGRTLCSIVFAKHYNKEDLRAFSIQCVTKKGVLGNSEVVGVYTDEFACLEEVPKRPDEKQMAAIMSLNKKINHILTPMIDEIKAKQDINMKRTLNKKKKEG